MKQYLTITGLLVKIATGLANNNHRIFFFNTFYHTNTNIFVNYSTWTLELGLHLAVTSSQVRPLSYYANTSYFTDWIIIHALITSNKDQFIQLPTKQYNNWNPLTNRLQTTRQLAERVHHKASMTEQSFTNRIAPVPDGLYWFVPVRSG